MRREFPISCAQDREFEALTLAYDEIPGRLEKSFKQASRFSAGAAQLRRQLARFELPGALREYKMATLP